MEATAMPAPVQSSLGRRIRRARFEMALEQAAFAGRIGVHLDTVSNWENDKSRPRLKYLERMSRLTGKPVVWFTDGIADDEL